MLHKGKCRWMQYLIKCSKLFIFDKRIQIIKYAWGCILATLIRRRIKIKHIFKHHQNNYPGAWHGRLILPIIFSHQNKNWITCLKRKWKRGLSSCIPFCYSITPNAAKIRKLTWWLKNILRLPNPNYSSYESW